MTADIAIPRVIIPLSVWQQMMAFVVSCPIEVNGFGVAEKIGNNIVIREAFILDQTATEVSTVIEPTAIAMRMHQMMEEGKSAESLKLQWHSHVNMSAYFSPTDTAYIDSWQGDWLVSLVLNTRGEYECRLDMFSPFRVAFNVAPDLVLDLSPEILEHAVGELTQHVKTPRGGLLRRRQPIKTTAPSRAMPLASVDVMHVVRPQNASLTVTEQ